MAGDNGTPQPPVDPTVDWTPVVRPKVGKRAPNTWAESVAKCKTEDERRALRQQKRQQMRARRRQVVNMWFSTYDPAEITRALGLKRAQVDRALNDGLQDLAVAGTDPRAFAVQERMRLLGLTSGLIRAHYPNAVGTKDKPGSIKSAEFVLKVAERRAKLTGADAPARTELTGADGAPIELAVEQEVHEVREALFRVVDAHPELRDSIADALLAADAKAPEPKALPTNGRHGDNGTS